LATKIQGYVCCRNLLELQWFWIQKYKTHMKWAKKFSVKGSLSRACVPAWFAEEKKKGATKDDLLQKTKSYCVNMMQESPAEERHLMEENIEGLADFLFFTYLSLYDGKPS